MAALRIMAGRRWHFVVLAFALVLAQGIALIHGVVHAPLASGSEQLVHADHDEHDHEIFVVHLFGDHQDHEGKSICHLFDQSHQSEGLCGVVAAVFPIQLASFIAAGFATTFISRWQASFQARGPPAFR